MLWKSCTQYASKSGKLRCGHRIRKGQFWFQSQRKTIPKNVQTTTQLHSSHARKAMLKILKARLQQYVNWELSDIQAGFRKGRGTRDQIVNIYWIIDKAREFQRNIYFCFDYAKAFYCGSRETVENSSRGGNTSQLNCLLRNLYGGQEATVKTGHGTMDWFQIGKGVYVKAVYCHSAYLTHI